MTHAIPTHECTGFLGGQCGFRPWGLHADVAGAKSFHSDVLGWETDGQPICAFNYTVMRSADTQATHSDQSDNMPLSRR